MATERYVVVRHTDHATHAYCVRDTWLHETHGYGLLYDTAAHLRAALEAGIVDTPVSDTR